MPIAILEKEIKTLPTESVLEMMEFIQYLKFKYSTSRENKSSRKINDVDVSKRFGAFPELSEVPLDIDFCNDEIAEMFGA